MQLRTHLSVLFVAGALWPGCSSATGTPDDTACISDPGTSNQGSSGAVGTFDFRNAFDPSDTASYDPSNVAELPGPLMVDTWGDRGTGAHGTLGVFPPGFSAPLHTHSNDYYGVVLRGEMTNPFGTDLEAFLDDDADNDHGETILGAGSYWHVPGGAQHTTTCVGPEVCWFYFHSEESFDFAPIIDEMGALAEGVELTAPHADSALVRHGDLQFVGEPGSFVQFAAAWGDMGATAHGTFGVFDAGAVSPVHIHGAEYYGVVVEGEMTNPFQGTADAPVMGAGGFWNVPANSVHTTTCGEGEDCLFYFHARDSFDFVPTCEQ